MTVVITSTNVTAHSWSPKQPQYWRYEATITATVASVNRPYCCKCKHLCCCCCGCWAATRQLQRIPLPFWRVGAATSIIFVMTKLLFVATKHVFCHYKSMLVVTKVLPWQTFFVMTNVLSQQIFVMTKVVMTNLLLSRQTCVCHDKTCVLSRQKYCCHDITVVVTNMCLSWHSFVATKVVATSILLSNTCLSWQNMSFVMTKVCLLWHNSCCDKHAFVVTNIVLLHQKLCHDKHTVVTPKELFCHDTLVSVATNVFVATKMILAASPAKDRMWLKVISTWQQWVSSSNALQNILMLPRVLAGVNVLQHGPSPGGPYANSKRWSTSFLRPLP